MTIEEMKRIKIELGLSNEHVAELSKVPLGTVQKIFAGETKSPRYNTILKLEQALTKAAKENASAYPVNWTQDGALEVHDSATGSASSYAYNAVTGNLPQRVKKSEYSPVPVSNRLGLFKGKYKIPDDIDFLNEEIAADFEEGLI